MDNNSPRILREKKTVEAMIRLYCKDNHDSEDELCFNCYKLVEYAIHRLDHCPFQERKPTCVNCKIHCYSPAKRTDIQTIMRYSGPRMVFKHPILALLHVFDGFRKSI